MIRPSLVFALLALLPLDGSEARTLTEDFHHLRSAEPREWSHYPVKAEGQKLEIAFDLEEDPASFQLLTLRQEGVKQAWQIMLNGRKLGQLERDHNDLEHALAVPPGSLKSNGNKLVISTTAKVPDDISVGEIVLHAKSRKELTEGARLDIRVTAMNGREPLPSRLTFVDAERRTLVLLGAESNDRLAVRAGVVYTLDGKATIGIRPGRYQIWAGRGFEYSIAEAEITVKTGETLKLTFELHHAVPTMGLVACDTHLHTGTFARHGNATLVERLITLAGEGIELPISTEHDQHVDYSAEAKRIGADKYFTPVTGCEVTTREGHFNSFPIEPGAKPAQHQFRKWPKVFENIYGTQGVKVVILNHARDIHGKFRPFGPEQFDPVAGKFTDGRELKANGLELINSGAQQSDPMRLVRDWFALLKSGHKIAGVGSSDSHTVNFAIAGQARTYVPCPDLKPGNLDVGSAVDQFLTGETHVSFGLLTQLEVTDEGKATARVLGPDWTQCTTLTLFADGVAIKEIDLLEEDGMKAGIKFEQSWTIKDLGVKSGSFLVAVADGPGIDEAYWPMMPPYQASTPDYEPYVMGISPARWVK